MKRDRRRSHFSGTLIRLISVMKALFKRFFTIFAVGYRMLRLLVSPPALKLPLRLTISKPFPLPGRLLSPGSPEMQWQDCYARFSLGCQVSFTDGLRLLSGSSIQIC